MVDYINPTLYEWNTPTRVARQCLISGYIYRNGLKLIIGHCMHHLSDSVHFDNLLSPK